MGAGGGGGGAPFRVPWSSLFKAAFRDGQDELPLGKLRKRVIKAAVAAAHEAGAPAPDSEDLNRDFITEVTFSEKLQVDGDTVRRKRKKQKTAHRGANEEVPPPAEADEEEEPGARTGDGGEEQELRQSRPSQVAWTTSRLAQRWGPFSQEEKATLDGAIKAYARQHGLSGSRLDWLFHTRSAGAADKERLRRVWLELAEALPHRSPKQVWAAVTRRLHEAKGQGRWSQEEADQLRGLVQQHGTAWTDIGAVLGRAPEECKDKWRVVKHGSAVKLGPWSLEELAQLGELVARFEAQQPPPTSGKAFVCIDNLNWEAMASVMKTRSAQQMRSQWYARQAQAGKQTQRRGEAGAGGGGTPTGAASPASAAGAASVDWTPANDAALVQALYDTGASEESEVDWGSLVTGRSGGQCLRRWRMLLKTVWAHVDKGFAACVEELRDKLEDALETE